MKETDYLSTEEQFKEILNNEEISRISDPELQKIRSKYWVKRHQAFLNERDIPDHKLADVFQDLYDKEKKEIAAYRKKYGL